MKKMNKFIRYFSFIFFAFALFAFGNEAKAQIQVGDDLSEVDYGRPKEYEIAGITVEGTQNVDKNALMMISGLRVGNTVKVPGNDFSQAIKKIWEQGMFEDVAINATDFVGDKVFLEIVIRERPRVSKFSFKGVKKTEADEIRNKINLSRGDVATDHLLTKTRRIIEDYYYEKGYLNADIDIEQVADTTRNGYVDMVINIDKGHKVKIGKINFIGNENLSDGQLQAAMKETKQRGHFDPLNPLGPLVVNTIADVLTLKPLKAITGVEEYFAENYRPRIFKASKYIESNYKDDKQKIIEKYNSKGYRDALIVRDSIYRIDDRNVGIDIVLDEGHKYHYRNITWTGNTKYTAETLDGILGIKKGDVYNKELLDKNLTLSETTLDISSLYMDDGYLFFHVNPVEVQVENDSIDLEIRMYEGEQARISNVSLVGNTKTNDYVVLRELYTRPGQLYSRSDVIRTVRELATLGFFNAETINPEIKPNYSDHTVDIEYSVEEAAADQIQFSAGYGYQMLMLQAGLQFSNFSMKKLFKKDAWKPIPGGDGQKLGLNVTTYGRNYIAYGLSFTEPWLGGCKPISLTVSVHQSYLRTGVKGQSNYGWFIMSGGTIGIGKRLTWPDDYFSLYQAVNIMRYSLDNYRTSYFNIGG
ncbi:MAG: outer membrane protein assembly factor BamA, partial [bacterium]|nr:outer membrane protein assembly factor BamA [Candidatus Limimorpha equi]